MKLNINEGGKWFTLWLDTSSPLIFRIWLAAHAKGFMLASLSFEIHNAWKYRREEDRIFAELEEIERLRK